jgi:hypothetical protein
MYRRYVPIKDSALFAVLAAASTAWKFVVCAAFAVLAVFAVFAVCVVLAVFAVFCCVCCGCCARCVRRALPTCARYGLNIFVHGLNIYVHGRRRNRVHTIQHYKICARKLSNATFSCTYYRHPCTQNRNP